jgi:hypothetical protein
MNVAQQKTVRERPSERRGKGEILPLVSKDELPSPGIEPRPQVPETCMISISPRGHKKQLSPITLQHSEQRSVEKEERSSYFTAYRSLVSYGKITPQET